MLSHQPTTGTSPARVTVLADAVGFRDLEERKVCATGSEKRPDSMSSDLGERVTARSASPLLNLTSSA